MNDSHLPSNPEPINSVKADRHAADHRAAFGISELPAPRHLLMMALGAGLFAGIVSWLIGEILVTAFRPAYQAQNVMGQTIMKASFKDQAVADFQNAALAFAVLGGTLAAALGMAGGLARKSMRAGIISSVVGLGLGMILGIAASIVMLPIYFNALERTQEELSRDLTLPLVVHAGIWAACGLAGGAAARNRTRGGAHTHDQRGNRRADRCDRGGGPLRDDRCGSLSHSSHDEPAGDISERARLFARLMVATVSAMAAAALLNMQSRKSGAIERQV